MNTFHLFGTDHIAVLVITFLLACAFIAMGKHLSPRIDLVFRYLSAIALFITAASGWIVAYRLGVVVIPINFCDLALLASIIALLTLQSWSCHLSYFWGLAGTLQALLQPDLSISFPGFWWFHFFATHAGVVLSAVYLAATHRLQPTLKTASWITLFSNAYLGIVVGVNSYYGTNFGYLAEKPDHPSILDYLGEWPYYLISMEVIGIISLLILFLPFSSFRESCKKFHLI